MVSYSSLDEALKGEGEGEGYSCLLSEVQTSYLPPPQSTKNLEMSRNLCILRTSLKTLSRNNPRKSPGDLMKNLETPGKTGRVGRYETSSSRNFERSSHHCWKFQLESCHFSLFFGLHIVVSMLCWNSVT